MKLTKAVQSYEELLDRQNQIKERVEETLLLLKTKIKGPASEQAKEAVQRFIDNFVNKKQWRRAETQSYELEKFIKFIGDNDKELNALTMQIRYDLVNINRIDGGLDGRDPDFDLNKHLVKY